MSRHAPEIIGDGSSSADSEFPLPLDRDQFSIAIAALNDIQDDCRLIVKEQMKRASKA